MKTRLLISFIASSVVIACIYCLTPDINTIIKFYGDNLRASFFGGFLTLGGFLFSLKTFIIIKMKENVYDHDLYKKRVKEQRKLNCKISYYGPLKRLSHMLFVSVLFSIVTAVLQFTVGLLGNPIAVLICIWFACFSITLLVLSLFIIKNNLDQWFDFLEDSCNK